MARPREGVSQIPIAFKPTLEVEPLLKSAKRDFNIEYSEMINRALERFLPEVIEEILRERKKAEGELMKQIKKLKEA